MLSSLQTTILSSLAAFMDGTIYTPSKETDWKALFKESVDQAVALSCLQGLDLTDMPIEVKQGWKNYAMRSLTSNVSIHEQHAYIHNLMTDMQIPYVIMKGSAAAYYYSDPLMRTMGDVDFWVLEKNASIVTERLKDDGWSTSGKWEGHHIAFFKGSAEIELHRDPAGIPKGELAKQIESYFVDVFQCAEEVKIDSITFKKPSKFHHGLILLMHMYHHLSGTGLGIRHFCDWAFFLKHFQAENFAELFQEKLSKVGLWKFAQIISYICYIYLEVPYCQWMGIQDDNFCALIMKAVFQGGNFGHKEGSLEVGTVLLGDKESKVQNHKPTNVIMFANTAGRMKYPKLAKVPIIKNLLFIPMSFRFIWQKITGKRKGRGVKDAMKTVEAKEQVYKQFELFEVKK